MKKKTRRGHFCWVCGVTRPNQDFSGRGHARHICRECQKLGKEELAVRQGMRNIDRLLGESGRVPRRKRAEFQRYLQHDNPRVRQYAEGIAAERDRERREARAYETWASLDELWLEDERIDEAPVHAFANSYYAAVPEPRIGELPDWTERQWPVDELPDWGEKPGFVAEPPEWAEEPTIGGELPPDFHGKGSSDAGDDVRF